MCFFVVKVVSNYFYPFFEVNVNEYIASLGTVAYLHTFEYVFCVVFNRIYRYMLYVGYFFVHFALAQMVQYLTLAG
jgi:hypothetical protein